MITWIQINVRFPTFFNKVGGKAIFREGRKHQCARVKVREVIWTQHSQAGAVFNSGFLSSLCLVLISPSVFTHLPFVHELPCIKNNQKTKLKCPDFFSLFYRESNTINKDSGEGQEEAVERKGRIFSFGRRYSKDFTFLKRNSKSRKIVNNSENSEQHRVLMTSASEGGLNNN